MSAFHKKLVSHEEKIIKLKNDIIIGNKKIKAGCLAVLLASEFSSNFDSNKEEVMEGFDSVKGYVDISELSLCDIYVNEMVIRVSITSDSVEFIE